MNVSIRSILYLIPLFLLMTSVVHPMHKRFQELSIKTSEIPLDKGTPFTPTYPSPSSASTQFNNQFIPSEKRLAWFLAKCKMELKDFLQLPSKKISSPCFFSTKLIENLPSDLNLNPRVLLSELGSSLLKKDLLSMSLFIKLLEMHPITNVSNNKTHKKSLVELNQIPNIITKKKSSIAISWNDFWEDKKILVFSKRLPCQSSLEIPCSQTPKQLSWSPKESFLVIQIDSHTLDIWDQTKANFITKSLTLPGKIENITWSPHENYLAIKSSNNNDITSITLWNIDHLLKSKSQKPIKTWDFENEDTIINTIRFSPDGNRLAFAASYGQTTIFNLATEEIEAELNHPSSILGTCAWNHAGNKCALYSENTNTLSIYSFKNKEWKLLKECKNTAVINPDKWLPTKIFQNLNK